MSSTWQQDTARLMERIEKLDDEDDGMPKSSSGWWVGGIYGWVVHGYNKVDKYGA
jgi:hypothetical protein